LKGSESIGRRIIAINRNKVLEIRNGIEIFLKITLSDFETFE
jgi:hypothetical protein